MSLPARAACTKSGRCNTPRSPTTCRCSCEHLVKDRGAAELRLLEDDCKSADVDFHDVYSDIAIACFKIVNTPERKHVFWGVNADDALLPFFPRLRALFDGLDDAGVPPKSVVSRTVCTVYRDIVKLSPVPSDAKLRKLGLLLAVLKNNTVFDHYAHNPAVAALLNTLYNSLTALSALSASARPLLRDLVWQVTTAISITPTVVEQAARLFLDLSAKFSTPRDIKLLLGYLQSGLVQPSLDWSHPSVADMTTLIDNSRLLKSPTTTNVRTPYDITVHTEAALKLRMAFREVKRIVAPLVHSWLRKLYPDDDDFKARFDKPHCDLSDATRPTDLDDTDTWDVYSVCLLLRHHATELLTAHFSGAIADLEKRLLAYIAVIFPLRNDNGHSYVAPTRIARGIACVADLLLLLSECDIDVSDDTRDDALGVAGSLRQLWGARLVGANEQLQSAHVPYTDIDEVFMRVHGCFALFTTEAHQLVKKSLQTLPVSDTQLTDAAATGLDPWAYVAFKRDNKTEQSYYHHDCQWSIDVLVTQVRCLIEKSEIGAALTPEKRSAALEAANLLTVLIGEMRHDKDLETTWQLDSCVKSLRTLLDALAVSRQIALKMSHMKTSRLALPKDQLHEYDESHPSFVPRRTSAFVGRDELLKSIAAKLASGACVHLIGDPGFGKSAIAAQIVCPPELSYQRVDCIMLAAHYVCRRDVESTRKAETFATTLLSRCNEGLPHFSETYKMVIKEELGGGQLRLTPSQVVGALARTLCRIPKPVEVTKDAVTYVIVVDGLDEALESGETTTVTELVHKLARDCPRWLRVLVTSRRLPRVTSVLSHVNLWQRVDLVDDVAGKEDMKLYAQTRLGPIGVTIDFDLFVKRAHGNFQWATVALDYLVIGRELDWETGAAGDDMDAFYLLCFRTEFDADYYCIHVLPIVNVLLAACEPLTPQQLFAVVSHAGGIDPKQRDPIFFYRCLGRLSQYLSEDAEGGLSFFHLSVRDWLTSQSAGNFYACVAKGHGMIALRVFGVEGCDSFVNVDVSSDFHICGAVRHFVQSDLYIADVEWYGMSRDDWNQACEMVKKVDTVLSLSILVLLLHVPTLCLWIKAGGGVHVRDAQLQHTMLIWASTFGSIDCLRILFSQAAGANVLQHDEVRGITALMYAAANGHLDCVEYLFTQPGGNEPRQDKDRMTALMYAAANGHRDCVEYLFTQPGGNEPRQDKDGRTALMYAAANGHLDCVKYLFTQPGGNEPRQDKDGKTALMYAAAKGHRDCVEYLFTQPGGNEPRQDKDGVTALMYAAANGHLGCVEYLFTQPGGNEPRQDKDGWTALLYAAAKGHRDCLKYLFENPDNSEPRQLHSVLTISAHFGHTGCVEYLCSVSNSKSRELQSALRVAVANTHFPTAFVLAVMPQGQYSADSLRPVLREAVRRGEEVVTRTLCTLDQQLASTTYQSGATLLMIAAKNGHTNVLSVLCEFVSSAQLNARNGFGYTATMVACLSNQPEALRLLCGRKADLRLATTTNKTALSIAQEKGHDECERVLREFL